MAEHEFGTVKTFNEDSGFGFITPDSAGEDVFVHHSEIVGTGFLSLKAGQRVAFHRVQVNGKDRAQKVQLVEGS